MAKGKPIAARELRRLLNGAFKLIDHLTFGESDLAKIDLEAQFFWYKGNGYFAHANFTGKGMITAKSALHGISKPEQKTLVTA